MRHGDAAREVHGARRRPAQSHDDTSCGGRTIAMHEAWIEQAHDFRRTGGVDDGSRLQSAFTARPLKMNLRDRRSAR